MEDPYPLSVCNKGDLFCKKQMQEGKMELTGQQMVGGLGR
jgi:hypothetical protein